MFVLSSGNDGIALNGSASHTLTHSACEATFKCISTSNGECSIEVIGNDITKYRQRGAVNSSISFSNLMSNTLYFYRINFTNLQPILIIENQNFMTDEGKKMFLMYQIIFNIKTVFFLFLWY